MSKFKPITHVIFDLDGTLLDTETINTKVFTEMARSYGVEFTPEINVKTLGRTETDTLKLIMSELGLEDKVTLEKFLEDYRNVTNKAVAGVSLLPGAKNLILYLHKNKIPFALATSSSDAAVKVKTAHLLDLFNLFHHKVMSGSDPEVKKGKPAPDIYLICASRFDPPADPASCLVFEDSPNGATGSVAAGMQVVAIPGKNVSRDLFPKNTTIFLKSLEEFKPEMFGLPPKLEPKACMTPKCSSRGPPKV